MVEGTGDSAMNDLPLFASSHEAEIGAAIVDELAELRAEYLEHIRIEMVRLYRDRRYSDVTPYVSGDDARRYFESLDPPSPEELSRNFLAGVWREKRWIRVGWIKSTTEGSHGNRIAAYQLKEV